MSNLKSMAIDRTAATDQVRVFGVGLDASDDPASLQLKLAAIHARENQWADMVADPYEVLGAELERLSIGIRCIGKLPLPTWLTPRPLAADKHRVTAKNFESFVAGGGILEVTRQVKKYVETHIFPHRPVMLGVDHSASGGVVEALSERVGPQNLGVVVIDQHFDGLPVSLRLDSCQGDLGTAVPPMPDMAPKPADDAYCCGNFLNHLLDKGAVLPENLLLIGMADYPEGDIPSRWERYRDHYLQFVHRGCSFFPRRNFDDGAYFADLARFVADNLTTSHVYVSLDLDVGAYACVHAARYMDRRGLDKAAMIAIADILSRRIDSGEVCLAGLDVMEFNMHFLGISVEPGQTDATAAIALEFMEKLLSVIRN